MQQNKAIAIEQPPRQMLLTQKSERMSINDLDNNGLAMDGMDPVAYYEGEGLQGSAEFSFELRGVTYQFANAENLEKFQEDPAQYIPDFAGSYLRHADGRNDDSHDQNDRQNQNDRAYLESRGMLDDIIEPQEGNIDPELKRNPGYETDDEVERSNLHDSNA